MQRSAESCPGARFLVRTLRAPAPAVISGAGGPHSRATSRAPRRALARKRERSRGPYLGGRPRLAAFAGQGRWRKMPLGPDCRSRRRSRPCRQQRGVAIMSVKSRGGLGGCATPAWSRRARPRRDLVHEVGPVRGAPTSFTAITDRWRRRGGRRAGCGAFHDGWVDAMSEVRTSNVIAHPKNRWMCF
jgi:hypothetical protein